MSSKETKDLPSKALSVGTAFNTKSIINSSVRLSFWLALFVAYLFVIPQFHRMSEEFGIEMPRIAQFVIASSDRMIKLWFLMIPLFMATLAISEVVALLLPLACGSSANTVRKWLNRLAWLALFLVVGITLVGVMAPLMSIISGLSQK